MSLTDDSRHWRSRAREALSLAETMTDPESKSAMLNIAAGYERIATRIDERLQAVKIPLSPKQA